MNTADGWDLTFPEDTADLAAEFRRHGVVAGQRLRIVQALEEPRPAPTPLGVGPTPLGVGQHRFGFIGSVEGGPADVSERVDEYLQRGFGRE